MDQRNWEVSCQRFCRTAQCGFSSGGGLQTPEGTCMGNNSRGSELSMWYMLAHTAVNVSSGSGLLIELHEVTVSVAEVACRSHGHLHKH